MLGSPRGRSEPLVVVVLRILLDPPVHLLPLDLLLALPEGGAAANHLVDQAAEAEPVRAEAVLLVVNDLGRHVADRPHPAPHRVALGDLHGQTEVGNPKIRGKFLQMFSHFPQSGGYETRRPQFY